MGQLFGTAESFCTHSTNSTCSANRRVLALQRFCGDSSSAGWWMYLRHTVVRKGGRVHTYWRLVRSVRRGRKVVQETVAQLGELDARGRARARALAQEMVGAGVQRELFEASPGGERSIAIRLDRVRLERARSFGAVWLGWTLWRALRLDQLCSELLPIGREAIPWAQLAAVLVIARLTEPSSELHIAESWYRTTALDDLLAIPHERIYDNRPLSCARSVIAAQAGNRTAPAPALG
jgi:hypothetical protein